MDNPDPAQEQQEFLIIISKGRREEVRIAFSAYRGKTYLAIRLWYVNDEGDWRPAKSGLNLPIGLLPDIADAVQRSLDAARTRGLV